MPVRKKTRNPPFLKPRFFSEYDRSQRGDVFQTVSEQPQTRAVVSQKPSEAQRRTPSGLRERSNQRLTFFLEGHGSQYSNTVYIQYLSEN